MSKTKETPNEQVTGLELLSQKNFTMDMIPDVLEDINKKIKDLKPKNNSVTSMLKKDMGSNLGSLTNITTLRGATYALASIQAREKLYNTAKKSLGIEVIPEFSIAGHSCKEWLEAVKQRCKEIENAATLKKLEVTKASLEKHVSKEIQFKNEMTSLFETFTKGIE